LFNHAAQGPHRGAETKSRRANHRSDGGRSKAQQEAVVVTFIEVTREDYASAGVLLADKK
jgi:hypothetical protein